MCVYIYIYAFTHSSVVVYMPIHVYTYCTHISVCTHTYIMIHMYQLLILHVILAALLGSGRSPKTLGRPTGFPAQAAVVDFFWRRV